jgi:predicted choloylglycine hydrolase
LSDLKRYTFSGSHYEIGFLQGRTIGESLHETIAQIPNLEVVKSIKPRLIPTSLFLALAKSQAEKKFSRDINIYYPNQAERLRGIAEGAGIDLKTIMLILSAESLITIKKSDYYIQACTSIALSPQHTSSVETIIGKNFDYPNEFAPFNLTCHLKPSERYQTLGCTMSPLPGILDGLNEHGLTVTYNLAYTTDKATHYVPISIMLQEMLETCKNAKQAVDFIARSKRARDAIITIADVNGNIKTIELSSNHHAIRNEEGSPIVRTNHFFTNEMQKFEIPKNAVYSGNAPNILHGIGVHESSIKRYERAKELLKNIERINDEDLKNILRDHGTDNKPSMFTICRHDDLTSTLRSVICYPNRKTIKVLYGAPCQKKHIEFKIP